MAHLNEYFKEMKFSLHGHFQHKISNSQFYCKWQGPLNLTLNAMFSKKDLIDIYFKHLRPQLEVDIDCAYNAYETKKSSKCTIC